MTQPFNLIMVSAFHEQGGNVLHRFLDSHPQLMVYPFESTLATQLSSNLIAGPQHHMPQRYSYPVFDGEWTAEQCYHAMADHELKPYLRARQTSKFHDCGLEMDEEKRLARFTDFLAWDGGPSFNRAGCIEALFRATFNTWTNFARTGKETYYVGYIPPILMDADKFFADFPFGHMVHIVRNPFSGYADTLKRPYPFPVERYCQMWNVCQMQAKVYEGKYPGRFHTVRYEDLIANPHGTLNELCHKLGLERFIDKPVPSFNRKPLQSVRPWGTIVSPTTEANLATAKELTYEETVAIINETLPMLQAWGYTESVL